MPKHIIVIGAGLGGLSAAIRLAHRGFKVSVFEKNATVGGKMQEVVSDNGYRFDTGPTLVTMPFVFEELFQSVGKTMSDYLSLLPLESACKYFFSDGSSFTAYCDLNRLREEIARIFPSETENFERYFQYAKKIYDATAENFIYNPLSLSRILKSNPLDLLHIDAFSTAHAANDRFFKDSRLVQFLDRFPTYVGSSPYLAPATLNVIPFVELAFGGFYVKGGMIELAKAYHKLAEEFGATFYFNQSVERILTSNGKVLGVQLYGGEKLDCDAIVSNDDAVHTYADLLGEKHIEKKYEASCSGFVLCLGVGATHEHLAHHNIFFTSNYEKEFAEIFERRVMPSEPTIYISISAKSDEGQAPLGKENWFVLINAPFLSPEYDWEKNKMAYRNLVINRLNSLGFESLDRQIEFEHIITPVDLKMKFNSFRGSIYGISSNNRMSAFLRPRNRGKVKGLYLASGSAHPGGGTPMVTLSGKFAAELLMADFKSS
ncbi:MAG: phytoene desaturase family protein [Chlorobiales bacterium]